MSNATVTPRMRSYGWNIHLLASPSAFHFAGIYQHPDNSFVTFRDLIDELRLCFDLPDATEQDPWADVAFGLDKRHENNMSFPRFVKEADLEYVIPSLPCRDPQERAVLRYHIVRHKPCDLASDSSLEAHLKDGCAQHIPRPQRRNESRYLPPKKSSDDARIARMPFRRRAKPRTGSQSPKRDNSGSVSPDKDAFEDGQDVSDMIVPVTEEEIKRGYAQQIMDSFRSSVMVSAKRCAVSGKGQSWCISPAIGPSLQACHIVPQQQFHLYPDPQTSEATQFSNRRLREAWISTWAPSNGILMMSHIHEFFDSRLFSIHPETLRIRAFVPYDAILDYHGATADVPEDVDRAALAHHYQMCCIENMAAKMPPLDIVTLLSRTATSGTNSPFTARSDLPATPGPDSSIGDPSKRPRTSQDETGKGGRPGGLTQDEDAVDSREQKRQKTEGEEWVDGCYDGYITPVNSCQFLADVNYELGKLVS